MCFHNRASPNRSFSPVRMYPGPNGGPGTSRHPHGRRDCAPVRCIWAKTKHVHDALTRSVPTPARVCTSGASSLVRAALARGLRHRYALVKESFWHCADRPSSRPPPPSLPASLALSRSGRVGICFCDRGCVLPLNQRRHGERTPPRCAGCVCRGGCGLEISWCRSPG